MNTNTLIYALCIALTVAGILGDCLRASIHRDQEERR